MCHGQSTVGVCVYAGRSTRIEDLATLPLSRRSPQSAPNLHCALASLGPGSLPPTHKPEKEEEALVCCRGPVPPWRRAARCCWPTMLSSRATHSPEPPPRVPAPALLQAVGLPWRPPRPSPHGEAGKAWGLFRVWGSERCSARGDQVSPGRPSWTLPTSTRPWRPPRRSQLRLRTFSRPLPTQRAMPQSAQLRLRATRQLAQQRRRMLR